MQNVLKSITFGPNSFSADTGTWTTSRAAGVLQFLKAANAESGKAFLEMFFPTEDEIGQSFAGAFAGPGFKGFGIEFAEIQYAIGTLALNAAPTLILYRERMDSKASTMTSYTVPLITPATFGLSVATHTERINPVAGSDTPQFQCGDRAVFEFNWDAQGNTVLALQALKVQFREMRT